MKANFKSIIMLILIVGAIIFAVTAFSGNGGGKDEFVYSELLELFDVDLVESYVVDESGIIRVKAFKPQRDTDGKIKFDEDGKVLNNPANRRI